MPDYDDLSEFDLLQLIDLSTKASLEGSLAYTCENWRWTFDSAALNEAFDEAADGDSFAICSALKATQARREAWWAAHPHPTQIVPLELHEAEVERRNAAGSDEDDPDEDAFEDDDTSTEVTR